MASTSSRSAIENLLKNSEVMINGNKPWDIQVHDPQFFAEVLHRGSLGLGESYISGLWDCPAIDEMIYRLLIHNLDGQANNTLHHLANNFYSFLFNLQNKSRAPIVGEKHYDLGNDLFKSFLDRSMTYSCGYWKNSDNLYDAQLAKMELIAQKLQLKAGMKILDIGCGWGSFAKYAAKNYNCEVTGVTISKEQKIYSEERCKGEKVKIFLKDYRELAGEYDRIVSIGMFEHVGHKNYKIFFQTIDRLLVKDGLFLLHTIGANKTKISSDPWINKYIFPNGILPSIKQLIKPTEKYFIMEDWQNFGPDYDQTLLAWHQNFIDNWNTHSSKYNPEVFRIFQYYLLSCAGAFRARNIQLWQIVFSRNRLGRYDAPR